MSTVNFNVPLILEGNSTVTQTWTPSLISSVNISGTPTWRKGRYKRIGDLVVAQVWIDNLSLTSGAEGTRTLLVISPPVNTTNNTDAINGEAFISWNSNNWQYSPIVDATSGNSNQVCICWAVKEGWAATGIDIYVNLRYFIE